MATKRQAVLTAEQWANRAVELAEARHLTGTARYIGQDIYRVPTTDRRDYYIVALEEHADHPRCHCKAALHGMPCAHAGAVLVAERQRAEAMRNTGRDEPFAWWLAGGEWDTSEPRYAAGWVPAMAPGSDPDEADY